MTTLAIFGDDVFTIDRLVFGNQAVLIYLTDKRALVVPMAPAAIAQVREEWEADRISSFRFSTPPVWGYAP